jgi:hypothetical protein
VEYPRLAPQRRTPPAGSAESATTLSPGGVSQSAVFLRNYNERTESREELLGKPRPDPESTEEILAANNAARIARRETTDDGLRRDGEGDEANLNRAAAAASWHGASCEITDPIMITGSAGGPSGRRAPVRIRVADNDANSAELVELVVEHELPRTSVRPGEMLAGRYRIIEKVSDCGMGLVYKASDKRREKAGMPLPWVALKFARPAGTDRPGTSSYLRQEFLKLSQLNHPNIVSVFDFDSDYDLDFIVMEWLEGETLANVLTHIASKRIALGKAGEIVRSVASALAHAHSIGVVHGDVKPSNIFLTDNRLVKLLDFGSSGESAAEGVAEPHWATRAYASCEVLRGDLPQPRDDVFALGVTAYCLLSGERPFGELAAAEARERGVVPEPLPPDAQEHWPAVERALRFDAAARSANAGEFLIEFADTAVDTARRAERSHLEHIAYGAVAVALLIAIVAWTVGSLGGAAPDEEAALKKAEVAVAAGRLVEPGGDSAFAYYSSVLATSPDNSAARDGLERIAERYLSAARNSLAAGDPKAAADNLAIAREVMPDHYGIAITGELIARYGKDLLIGARETAARDLEQAEQLLARAGSFLPAEDSTLASVKAELAQHRLNARLEFLLRGIDQRILAERLSMPQGDSALDLLREARKIAPGDRQVSLAADRIATALLFQAMFAISSGKLDDAERFIDAANGLDVKHLALARAQYELAKARHEAVRARGTAGS